MSTDGTRRPHGFWRDKIRAALEAQGGRGWLTPEIYGWIERNVELTDEESAESPHQGRPYWVNTVRGIASDMVESGQLVRIQDGLYRLPRQSGA